MRPRPRLIARVPHARWRTLTFRTALRCDRGIGALGRDGGACAQLPDTLAKGIGGETPITDHPSGHIGQTTEQPRGKRQFMRRTGASATAMARPRLSAITQAFAP